MNYLYLTIAALLPCVAGYYCLQIYARLCPTRDRPTTRLRQAGYGVFIGYALLQGLGLASAALLGDFNFWPITAALLTTTAVGVIAPLTGTPSAPVVANPPASRGQRILFWLLLAGLAVHLLLGALEISQRPIYPWDAWHSWMYRAKAWFFTGDIVTMSSPQDWATGASAAFYNVPGNHYPSFLPISALWIATAWGNWSDTLVNLPTLLCGAGVCAGIYGQCREHGTNRLVAVAATYAVISIPLLGTHLALAGQADIWMAGFAGLGFIALIRGLTDGEHQALLLGLAMIGLSIGVKEEGSVWLLAALLTTALVRLTRITLGAALAAAALLLLLWALGIHHVALPSGGVAGFQDGQFHIPFMGAYTLHAWEVWDEYRDNLFLNGTWNLLWPVLVLGTALLVTQPRLRPIRWPVLCFFAVFAITQIAIFGFTDAGRWAEDQTAINRLPLHIAPALVFCLALIVHHLLRNEPGPGHGRLPEPTTHRLTPALALAAVIAGTVLYAQWHLTDQGSEQRSFSAGDLRPVVGGGLVSRNKGIVNRYEGHIAILSSGPTAFDASGMTLLHVKTGGENRRHAGFFWRRAGDKANVNSVPLPGPGTWFIDLGKEQDWEGTITEVGLIFYEDQGRTAEFYKLELAAMNLPARLRLMWNEWTRFEAWGQYSAHWIAGGAQGPSIPLPLLVIAWLALTALLLLALKGRRAAAHPAIWLAVLAGWCLLDLRWVANLTTQAGHTMASYNGKLAAAYIDAGQDRQVAAFIEKARRQMGPEPAAIMVGAINPDMRFQMFRARYHLLPHAGYVHEGPYTEIPPRSVDYVLIINPMILDPGKTRPPADQVARRLEARLRHKVTVALDSETGTLFRVMQEDRKE